MRGAVPFFMFTACTFAGDYEYLVLEFSVFQLKNSMTPFRGIFFEYFSVVASIYGFLRFEDSVILNLFLRRLGLYRESFFSCDLE